MFAFPRCTLIYVAFLSFLLVHPRSPVIPLALSVSLARSPALAPTPLSLPVVHFVPCSLPLAPSGFPSISPFPAVHLRVLISQCTSASPSVLQHTEFIRDLVIIISSLHDQKCPGQVVMHLETGRVGNRWRKTNNLHIEKLHEIYYWASVCLKQNKKK